MDHARETNDLSDLQVLDNVIACAPAVDLENIQTVATNHGIVSGSSLEDVIA